MSVGAPATFFLFFLEFDFEERTDLFAALREKLRSFDLTERDERQSPAL